MAANIGRLTLIKKGTNPIAGVNAKSIKWAGEPIDLTVDNNSGRRKLATALGMETLDISIEGIYEDDTLKNIALLPGSNKMLTDITIAFPNGDAIATGTGPEDGFLITSFELNGEMKGAVKFSATLQSSGTWLYTTA